MLSLDLVEWVNSNAEKLFDEHKGKWIAVYINPPDVKIREADDLGSLVHLVQTEKLPWPILFKIPESSSEPLVML